MYLHINLIYQKGFNYMVKKFDWIIGSEVLKRWDMKPTDLFYVTQNHKIRVEDEIGRTITDSITEKVVEGSYKINSIVNEMFCRSDFERLYHKYKQSMPKRSKFIYGNKLMERWRKNDKEICRLIYNDDLSVVDRFGCKIEFHPLFYYLHVIPNCADDQLFLLTEIEKFERNHPELKSLKNALPLKVQELIKNSKHEIDAIYNALKLVGFSSTTSIHQSNLKKAAIEQFELEPVKFNFIKKKFLENNTLYRLASGKTRKYFYGRILQIIVIGHGFRKYNYNHLLDFCNSL